VPEESYFNARILEVAARMFLRGGFSNVTTNEIAYEAGISKKTLYRFIPSKKKLISRVIDKIIAETESRLNDLWNDPGTNSLEKIVETFRTISERLAGIGTALMQDFGRTIPEEWRKIEEFRRHVVTVRMKALMFQAKEEGLLRAEADIDLLMDVLFMIIGNSLVPSVLDRMPHSPSAILEEVIGIFFLGIVSDSGRELLGVRLCEK
jgi:AcrR family transcriptional regulator